MVSPTNTLAQTSFSARAFGAATAHLTGPVSVIDLAAFDHNAQMLVRRAAGKQIRLATKSIRVRALIDRVLANPGFAGLMAYSLAEALWLVECGYQDILVAYPTVDRGSLGRLAAAPRARAEITIMVDCAAHLELVKEAVGGGDPIRVAIDIDSSLRIFERTGRPIHLGVRRSPVHSAAEAGALAALIASYRQARLVGLMFYDAQIAGMPDSSVAIRLMKRLSDAELANRRREVIDAVLSVGSGPLEIINGGGTGSLHLLAGVDTVTESTAGSGLLHPTLFDGYHGLGQRPAAYYGLDIVRNPSPKHATAFSGGYIASGPVGRARAPRPVSAALKLIKSEGMGEVQSPFEIARGHGVPKVGDRVWFRHAKAGEQMERFNSTYAVSGDQIVEQMPTYRGEGKNFG